MSATKEDLALILQLEQTYRPSKEAKAFCWSAAVEGENAGPRFWEKHGLDSDERMYVNAYATYFEMFALVWQKALIDAELILDWVPAEMAWGRVGPILQATRQLLGNDHLWTGFEALAAAQAAMDDPAAGPTPGDGVDHREALDVWPKAEMSPFESGESRVRGRWINGMAHRGRDEPTYSEWEIERAGVQDCHPYYEVNFLIEGELYVESDGRTVKLHPGDTVLVRPGHVGRYWAPLYARMFSVDGPNPEALPSSDFDYWEINEA